MHVPLIPVELTPDIAIKLRFMIESGIFDMRGGNAVLSFAPNGELKSIKKEQFMYASKLPVDMKAIVV